jgi:2,5-diketo-D-gluconate reductase A
MPTSPNLVLNDGRRMPALGVGLWQVPADATPGVVADALSLGYRLIDGAAIYGNEAGLGQGLRQSGLPRDQVFVTTKCWNNAHGHDAARRAFDESLTRMGLDHVDLYLIHWPCPDQDRYVETWRALIALWDEGRARSIGVSNFHQAHLERLVGETGVAPAINQIELHPLFQQGPLRETNRRLGIVTQSWSPLGRGRCFDNPTIRAIADRVGRSPAQVILRWHLDLGLSVIPRSTRKAGLAENAALFDFALTAEDHAAIAALDAGERLGPDPERFS